MKVAADETIRDSVGKGLQRYDDALSQWKQMDGIFAAQSLFMATEALTEVARTQELKEQGKSEAELLKPHIDTAISIRIPNQATLEERDSVLEVYQKYEIPGPIADSARNAYFGAIRRKWIFHDSPQAYSALKRASDGLEHGYMNPEKAYALALPFLDIAASCLRRYILQQLLSEDGLVADLASGANANPAILGKFELMALGEFKSPMPFPTPALWQPPFLIRLAPVPPAGIRVEAMAAVPSEVEVRNIQTGIRVPGATFNEESQHQADMRGSFFGYTGKPEL